MQLKFQPLRCYFENEEYNSKRPPKSWVWSLWYGELGSTMVELDNFRKNKNLGAMIFLFGLQYNKDKSQTAQHEWPNSTLEFWHKSQVHPLNPKKPLLFFFIFWIVNPYCKITFWWLLDWLMRKVKKNHLGLV